MLTRAAVKRRHTDAQVARVVVGHAVESETDNSENVTAFDSYAKLNNIIERTYHCVVDKKKKKKLSHSSRTKDLPADWEDLDTYKYSEYPETGISAQQHVPQAIPGPAARAVQPSRDARSREAIRRAARARAERSPGAEPEIERSRAERGATPPSRLRVAARRLISAAERRFPWLATRVQEPSLDIERSRDTSPKQAIARSRRRSASVLLAAILITAVGGVASVYLNRTDPTLDAAANARESLAEAIRASFSMMAARS